MGRRSASPRSRSRSRGHRRSPSPDGRHSRRRRSRSRSPSRSRSRSRDRRDRRDYDRHGRGGRGGRDRSRDRSRDRNGRGQDRGGYDRRPQPQSLLVRGLNANITADVLRQAFSRREGDIRDVYIPKDFNTNEPRGFAFIEFHDEREAREVKREMDRTMLDGQEIGVLFAQQRRKTPDQMRYAEKSDGGRSNSPSQSRQKSSERAERD